MSQNGADELAEAGPAGQIGAVGGDVDAGEHDLAIAVLDEFLDLPDHGAHRHRPRIAAAVGNDAKGAAMVAAVLHFYEGTSPPVHPLNEMERRIADGHDVVDAYGRRIADEVDI